MLICTEFIVNADIGFTYSLEDLSILTYTGDANLQQFVNKWDIILAELEVDKIARAHVGAYVRAQAYVVQAA